MRTAAAALALLFVAIPVLAQTAGSAAAPAWSASVTASTYLVPDDANYVEPRIAVDRDTLHLEARFNYESPHTGSLWGGYAFSGGDDLAWELRPMIGAVFGDLAGMASGYAGSVTWRRLDAYSEGELVVSSGEDDFFYNWSEVGFAPAEWLRVGIVTQRTRAYRSDRDLQRGVLVGLSVGPLEATTYVLNPDDSAPTLVLSVGWSFGGT